MRGLVVVDAHELHQGDESGPPERAGLVRDVERFVLGSEFLL